MDQLLKTAAGPQKKLPVTGDVVIQGDMEEGWSPVPFLATFWHWKSKHFLKVYSRSKSFFYGWRILDIEILARGPPSWYPPPLKNFLAIRHCRCTHWTECCHSQRPTNYTKSWNPLLTSTLSSHNNISFVLARIFFLRAWSFLGVDSVTWPWVF